MTMITVIIESSGMTMNNVVEYNIMTMITVIQLGGGRFLDDSFTVKTLGAHDGMVTMLCSQPVAP